MTWLTMQEAAARTGYSVRTLERYIATGRLRAFRAPGGALRPGAIRLRSDDVDGLFTPVLVVS